MKKLNDNVVLFFTDGAVCAEPESKENLLEMLNECYDWILDSIECDRFEWDMFEIRVNLVGNTFINFGNFCLAILDEEYTKKFGFKVDGLFK